MPAKAGVGLKPPHYRQILEQRPPVGWFEVHAENYLGAGGPPHAALTAIREHYPLSIHGVGLSIGGAQPPDRTHLRRLRALLDRYQPALFSEHLAWSSHGGRFLNDLLPLPYTEKTLAHVAAQVSGVQEALGRPILIENPSTYVRFHDETLSEPVFLAELAARSGCGLLLDLNNVYVSAANHDFDPVAYLAAFPLEAAEEVHLAGHATSADDLGRPLLIDAHDREVAAPVWALFRALLARAGPLPTLIEWDSRVPTWECLQAEAARAQALLDVAGDRRHGGH
ncbi:DUF692 domain-containing protein [Alkalilimnicola sp. S0819]|nr:DUF692 domain-containing protein [Alkalilimnicola sp. S0819]